MTRPNADCAHAYGFYDRRGLCHANAVNRADAAGYYDRDGNWIDGAPSGYYDTNGNWVAGVASGYYDNGRWIPGPATGRYDENGRWLSGQPSGHRDANGAWVADPQPGYYDTNGRWRPGQAMGYYDAQGRWISTGAAAVPSRAPDTVHQAPSRWSGAPADVRSREAWLEQRIRRGASDGSLTRYDANRALRTLTAIRRQDTALRRHRGWLSPADEATIQNRLDSLSDSLRWARQDNGRPH